MPPVTNEAAGPTADHTPPNAIDYVGIIGACGGLLTALTGFFQLGSFSSSFAFLFLSFLLFWLMFKSNTVNRLYLLSASVFLIASMLCIYFVSFKTVHVFIRRTDPLSPDVSYPVYIQPGNEDLPYSKKLSLDIPNLATVTVDLNKADFQILTRAQKIENTVFETAKNQVASDIVPVDAKSSAPDTAKAIRQILMTPASVRTPSTHVPGALSVSGQSTEP
jgi:hypothetical protein